mmetsp:Transcript_23394/g.27112  ORF Transcript_23394/g.27112 Transcript_23394/m.27112 type:complete len:101 (-) Transcript_23394:91-393(-)
MADKSQLALRFYRLITKSLTTRKDLRVFRDNFKAASDIDLPNNKMQLYLDDYKLYLKSVNQCQYLYEIYGIGIEKDTKRDIENVSKKVGLRLPKLNEDLK